MIGTKQLRSTAALLGCAVLFAACSDTTSPTAVVTKPATPDLGFIDQDPTSPYTTPRTPDVELFEVCKDYLDVAGKPTTGPSVTFTVNDGTSSSQVTIAAGQCRDVYILGGDGATVTVTESVPTGYDASWVLQQMTGSAATRQTSSTSGTGNSVSGKVSGRTQVAGVVTGSLAVFTNRERPASIGDRVWSDTDGDGVQDAGEAGLVGWTATISGANLPSGYTTTQPTGANGIYNFTNLPAGTYQVCITPSAGYSQTYDLDGLATPHCASRTVVLGENATDVDFGYQAPLGAIGDFVWNDLNANGIQDAGEPGIAGVVVTLGGAASATTTTNANGAYSFTGLAAGNYTVTVGTPSGFTASPSAQGGNTSLDSNGSPANVTLATNGATNMTIDFGFFVARTVSCTLTQGYWKNHQEQWDAKGEMIVWNGQTFFNSGKTYAQIYAMSAAGGNGYIQLAHQYIAAKLNLNGASDPTINASIAQAEALLNGAAQGVSYVKNSQWTALASKLDSYNTGATGPGHCD